MSEPSAPSHEWLEHCQLEDVAKFKKALALSRRQHWSSAKCAKLNDQIQVSVDKTMARDALVRTMSFPDLPVTDRLPDIQVAFENHQVIIVSGETGSGKTTQLPKMALQAGRGRRGLVGHTQPRRIAARSVAERIAEECQYVLGQEVGYKVRFHDHCGPNTLIKLMTDGILLAEIRSDSHLRSYDTLIIDEAHERSLNTDFLLGYLKWLLSKRPDLKLIITSATIDTERFANHFKAPVIDVSGRSYPVAFRYRPLQDPDGDQGSNDLFRGVIDGVHELKREGSGDILVFLPGERDIRDAADVLRKEPAIVRDYEILALYGRLSAKEQSKIFQSHSKRRVVLATNVAETSLTVPGIRYVIDSGLARVSRYSLRSKIQRLPIEPVSQASANQRAGRCGRVAPGICIRLYDEDDFERRAPFTEAEILRVNLASVVLQMKHLNLGDIENFPFLEPPEPKAIRNGVRLLQELNALDPTGRLTGVGKTMARFPIEPRLSRILVEAQRRHSLTEACILVAALSIQDPRERPSDKGQKADQAQSIFVDERSDFQSLLNLWQAYQLAKKEGSRSALRRYCRDHFLSWLRMNEWEEVWRQIVRIATQELKLKLNHEPADYQALHSALVAGMLSHIGFKQEGKEYLGARNLRFHLFPGSGVFKKPPKWILAAEQVETSRVFARTVAAIEPAWIEACAAHMVKRSYTEPYWSRKQGRALVSERQTLFGLTLVQGRKVPLKTIDAPLARELFIRSALVDQDFHSRATFFTHNQQVLEAAGYIEHKQRRADLVVDEQWLFDFYDHRIPSEVVDARSFERWRKKAEADDSKQLFLQPNDLLRSHARHLPEDEFPDMLAMGDLNLELSYRFSPGADDDGVTARVEIHQLNQFDCQRATWLVPGLLREKVIQLLRTLPKPVRKSLGPIPYVADRFLAAMPDQGRALCDSLARFVRSELNQRQSPGLSEEGLDGHLRMNIHLFKDQKVVAETRDIDSLIAHYADHATAQFAVKVASQQTDYCDLTQWHDEGIPEHTISSLPGGEMRVYPALCLVESNDPVGQQLKVSHYDSAESAKRSHIGGLMFLLKGELKSELKYLNKHLRDYRHLELLAAQLPQHPWLAIERKPDAIIHGVVDVALESLFLSEGEKIRSQPQLQQALTRKSELINTCNDLAALLDKILRARQQIRNNFEKTPGAKASKQDLIRHMDTLVYAGFYQDVAIEQLAEYPRYFRALEKRLERLVHASAKDDGLLSEAIEFETMFWSHFLEEDATMERLKQANETEFRWLLEEYRIALFAQPMKTRVPISAKRMTKAWNQFLSKV